MKQKLILTQTIHKTRVIHVDVNNGDTKESIQELVAIGINNLGFDNVGELESEYINDFIDDINVDSLN